MTQNLLSFAENPQKQVKRPMQRLLRPKEADTIRDEIKNIEALDDAPAYIRSQIQDKPAKAAQKRRLQKTLEENVPSPFEGEELDRALQVEEDLRADILTGMCTQAEMRRRPPGAVSKHIAWEVRNKDKILKWKNIRLRLQASNHDFGHGRTGAQVASLEPYRPAGGSQELSMDGAQIPGKEFHLRGGESVVFSDEALAHIKLAYPDVYPKLAMLSPDQREVIKAQVEMDMAPQAADTADIMVASPGVSAYEKDEKQPEEQ